MHDAVELEKRHIPAVAVCTDLFRLSAAATAEARGMPAVAVCFVLHPLSALADDQEVCRRADAAAAQVVRLLTDAG